jgi:hypothetical protein
VREGDHESGHLDRLAVRTCAIAPKRGGMADKPAVLNKLLTSPLLNPDGVGVLKSLIRPKPADAKSRVDCRYTFVAMLPKRE